MLNGNLSLIFGQFGAGKTYYTVREAKRAFLDGAVVISNTWLAFPHIRFYSPEDLPAILEELSLYYNSHILPSTAPLSYTDSHSITPKDIDPLEFFILIDEGGLFFNNRNFAKNFSDKSVLEMLVQPRKYGMQICVVTQDLEMLDKNFIRLAQEVVEFVPKIF